MTLMGRIWSFSDFQRGMKKKKKGVNTIYNRGFPGDSDGKEPCNAGHPGSIPGWGRSLREGNGNPLQYSCLENSMDRGAWRATVHGIAKSRT